MTTPDTAAIRARLQAATWQLIGDETPRNVQSAPGDNGRRPVLVTRWPITGAYKPVCVACLTVDGIWLGGRRRKLWFEPTHWRPLPEDPGEDAPGAALLEAYDARGEEIERLRAKLEDEIACDVLVPPVTIVRKGCPVGTLLTCIERRRGTDDVSFGSLAEERLAREALEAQIAALTAAAEGARAGAIEEAARVCEAEWQTFLSPEYATGQPLSSFQERFACSACAAAIRALAAPATGDANG